MTRKIVCILGLLSQSIWCLAQEKAIESPIKVVEAHFSQPQIETQQVEGNANRYYEKWREKTLVVFAYVPPQAEEQTYKTQPLKRSIFTLRLQTEEKKANFEKQREALKAELQNIKSVPPQLKVWDTFSVDSKGETEFRQQTIHASNKYGYVCYAWLYRNFEIEGGKQGKKTMFKAQMDFSSDGPILKTFQAGEKFNLETGEVK